MLDMRHWAIKDPIKLYAEPIGLGGDTYALVAEDADGRRLTIVASRERFVDALMGRGLRRLSPTEQVREMYLRGEVEVEAFERALDRDAR